MRPIHKVWTMAAADDNAVCLSQKPTGAGYLTINGVLAAAEMDTSQLPSVARTVANLDVYRHIAIASDADERAATFVVTYADATGGVCTESITGPNATAAVSVNGMAKIISVHIDRAAAGNLTVGTTATAETPWFPISQYPSPAQLTLQAQFSAGASLSLQWQATASPVQDGGSGILANPIDAPFTASSIVVFEGPVTAVRGKFAGFSSGTVTLDIIRTAGS